MAEIGKFEAVVLWSLNEFGITNRKHCRTCSLWKETFSV